MWQALRRSWSDEHSTIHFLRESVGLVVHPYPGEVARGWVCPPGYVPFDEPPPFMRRWCKVHGCEVSRNPACCECDFAGPLLSGALEQVGWYEACYEGLALTSGAELVSSTIWFLSQARAPPCRSEVHNMPHRSPA